MRFTIIFLLSGFACMAQENAVTYDLQYIDGQKVYKQVDKMPRFKGDLSRYLPTFIIHPAMDEFNVTFIIDTAGAVRYLAIDQKKPAGYSQVQRDLLDLASHMPKWQPGRLKGRKVPVRMYVHVSVHLE